jgi:AraC-like DNA-binding protein
MAVAIYLVRAVVAELRRTGHDADAILAEARIDPAFLLESLQRIAEPAYDRLQRRAVEVSADPAFGLHMGEHFSLAAFNLLGQMAVHARTLREGFEVLASYHRIMADVERPELVCDGPTARFVYPYLRSSDPFCNRVRAEFGLTGLLTFARSFQGVEDDPRLEFWFDHAPPEAADHAREYTRIFGGRERFNAPHAGVTLPSELLSLPLTHFDPSLYDLLKERAEGMLQQIAGGHPLAERIHELIVRQDPVVQPEMAHIASRLGMSERSLRRHLLSEGRSYSEIVNEARGEVACRLLDRMTIQEAAHELGFASPGAFHRAFRRWTGQTPGDYCRSASTRGRAR